MSMTAEESAVLERVFPMSLSNYSRPRQAALAAILADVGGEQFRKFTGMIGAVRMGQWSRAAREALKSSWAEDHPENAVMVAEMLRLGQWPG